MHYKVLHYAAFAGHLQARDAALLLQGWLGRSEFACDAVRVENRDACTLRSFAICVCFVGRLQAHDIALHCSVRPADPGPGQ